MAGVHQGKARVVPDITKLLKQREKITEFLKYDKTNEISDDRDEANQTENIPSVGENSVLSEKVEMIEEKDVSVHSKGDEDVFSYEGELTISEGVESGDDPSESEDVTNIAEDEIKGNSAPAINDLKNTINEVFWDKINSHVENLLNTYENDSQLNSADDIQPVGPRRPEQPQISCQKLNTMTRKDTKPLNTWLKEEPSSKGRGPCHRKSMLEISSTKINDNLISIFRRDMHCTDACVIRVVDKSGIFRQSHVNRTIPMVCIDRSLLQDNVSRLKPGTYLRIIRMENEGSIKVFQSSDVFAKRSVIKGGDILRTLAVYEMREKFDFEEQHTMDKETRKVMYNKFTNMQRLDRGVGSRLKWQFMERHSIEETDTIECLEEKADVSFSIFGVDGYLSYESKTYRMKHVSMIKDYAGLYYFIPQKMLSAFGSQWNRRYRSDRYFKSKIKSEESSEASPEPSPSGPPKRRRARLNHSENKQNAPASNPPSSSLPTLAATCEGNVKNESTSPEPVKPAQECETRPVETKTVHVSGGLKLKAGSSASNHPSLKAGSGKRKTLVAQIISDSSEILPNDGMSWRKIRDGKSVIYPKRKSTNGGTEDPVLKKELSGPQESGLLKQELSKPPSLPRSPLKPPEIVKAGVQHDSFAAVPRVSAANIPTVRLLPLNGPSSSLKRSSDSKTSPPKRIQPIKSIGVLSKNQILTKGEVLLTTKDHIIFRIPRNMELPECSDKSADRS